MKEKNPLVSQDYFLWEQVCRTTVPLFQESQQKQKPTIVKEQKKKIIKAKKKCFDHTVHRKIAKGLCRIEARIDLHGLIQDEAYRCLKEFLQSSHRWGLRYVLVITGKGHSHGSNGVLCQFVPYWLSTPVFQYYVQAFGQAAHKHGGIGALYIQLRRFLQREKM